MSQQPSDLVFDSSLQSRIRSRVDAVLAALPESEADSHRSTLQQRLPHLFDSEQLYAHEADARPMAQLIDHTLLRADATRDEIRALCDEALRLRFASVCVNGCRVPDAVAHMKQFGGSDSSTPLPLVCAVVGFPLGAMSTAAKEAEARDLLQSGARELDMVLNNGHMLEGNYAAVLHDVQRVCAATHEAGGSLKVILETCLLGPDAIIDACLLCALAGADFVKTSTGFSTSGAQVWQVRLMRAVVGPKLGVKASGGIRDLTAAKAMVDAGASRIGCSAGVKICEGDKGASAASGAADDGKY